MAGPERCLLPSASIVSIEAFAGILSVSEAFRQLDLPLVAAYAFEICPAALTVARNTHPLVTQQGDMTRVTDAWISERLREFPNALFVLTGGPPCKDVSRLNASGRGAWGPQSRLREEFKRLAKALFSAAPQRAVGTMECTKMSTPCSIARQLSCAVDISAR